MTLGAKIRKSGLIKIDGVDFDGYFQEPSGALVLTWDDDGNDGRLRVTKEEQAQDLSGQAVTEIDGHEVAFYTLELNFD